MYDRKKGPAAAEPLERETLGEQGLAKKDFRKAKVKGKSNLDEVGIQVNKKNRTYT